MTTNRTPINRHPAVQITPLAISLFQRMQRCKCTCKPRDWKGEYWKHEECPGCRQWWKLHNRLWDELKCKPWQWPCIEHPESKNPWPEGSAAAGAWVPDEQARELWRMLDEDARAQERQRRRERRARSKLDQMSPLEPVSPPST
jgi:hypothetical protein